MMAARLAIAALACLSALPLVAQDRTELLANPKYVEKAQPAYVECDSEGLEQKITVVSGRNYAWFGFNMPEIRLVLPACDNSRFAQVQFEEPRVFDADGRPVAYELEHGLYDHELHTSEIRLSSEDPDHPVEFARAAGRISVRYPSKITTLIARQGRPMPDGVDIQFDGPFVSCTLTDIEPAEDAAGEKGSFRALDASGRQLEPYPWTSFSSINGVETEQTAYWGDVAEVRIDTVQGWIDLEVQYELPPIDPIPEEQAGLTPATKSLLAETPGGEFEVRTIGTVEPALAAAIGSVTKEEAVNRLRQLGFPEASEHLFVMSAVQGKLEAVKMFLAAGVQIDAAPRGATALGMAAQGRQIDTALFLVSAGADVDITDSNNATPLLHAAANCGATELVRALLDVGADPTPTTRGGIDAARMAEISGCNENARLIRAARGRR